MPASVMHDRHPASMTAASGRGVRHPSDPARRIRAVLFDLDGTLYRQKPLRRLMALELMTLPLAGPLQAPTEIGPLAPGQAVIQGDKVDAPRSFESVLGQLVEEVNSKQLQAGEAVHGLLSGEDIPLHRVMLATEEASISFQLMVEVRNKLLEAYQELMRMQV